MKFSEEFSIRKRNSDDWFDPILSIDSKLFIDPFLIFKSKKEEFRGVHNKMVEFFNKIFKIVAQSGGEKNNLYYKKARSLLLFPEVGELCLGYTRGGTRGSGSGRGFSNQIYNSMWEMIKRGIKDIRHFEELGIFNEGIGADRISDMTANLIKSQLILYTQKVCKTYNIQTTYKKVRNSNFDHENGRWFSEKVKLPINPINRHPIILVPESFLDYLPEINSEDFWDYLVSFENERLRSDLNYDIAKRVDKKTIVSIARIYPVIVRRYTDRKESLILPRPYNFKKDPRYLIQWYDDGKYCATKYPIRISEPQNEREFIEIITKINQKYKQFIEFQKGYELLWNDDGTQRSESIVQRSYLGVVRAYCEMNDIDVSKEANIGRGPVDFKFSKGYQQRVLLEIKLANNSHFWSGLGQQLLAYLKDNEVKIGFFLIVRFSKKDDKRLKKIKKVIKKINSQKEFKIIDFTVNAESRPSASKLRGFHDR